MLEAGDFVVRDLLDQGRITASDLDRARSHAAQERICVPEALLALRLVDSRELAITRAAICESPFVDLEAYDIDIQNASLMPRSAAEKNGAFPLFRIDGVITVGMIDPLNLRAVDAVRQALKTDVATVLCEAEALRALIARAYTITSTMEPARAGDEPLDLTTGEEPIVAAVNSILRRAVDEGASDVHINPDEDELHLRYRIDGVLQSRQGPGLSAHAGLAQRIKVMANLDLTQTRRPQDGKFRFHHAGAPVDVRVSTIPTVCGENIVMRLLRQGVALSNFPQLGMPPALVTELEQLLAMPHGMVLVTGPTGSGKTTTLYTALSKLNTPDRNLMTIEDPVEIRLPMVRQTQVNPDAGLTFAGALRSMLRQDPDVILLGEIRDEETAHIAMQASLTGHLVLSTLHTNDAVGAVARLRDFGIPPFAINASLLCVIAQRVVRRICEHCARPAAAIEATLSVFNLTAADAAGLREGVGCARCMNTGYRGRIGVYEMLRLTPAVHTVIERGGSSADIQRAALGDGMKAMFEDGLEKARLGLTTLDELWNVRAAFSGAERPQRKSA